MMEIFMNMQTIFFWIHLTAGNAAGVGVLNIAVLVFREGLECVLVLATITAGMNRDRSVSTKPIVAGVAGRDGGHARHLGGGGSHHE